jgi:DNA-directed RNA polymerase specialized sigma24 family protein
MNNQRASCPATVLALEAELAQYALACRGRRGDVFEDAVQTAFISVLCTLRRDSGWSSRVKSGSQRRAYLSRAVWREYRKALARQAVEEPAGVTVISDPRDDIEDLLGALSLSAFCDELTSTDREILQRRLAGEPYEVVAHALGMTPEATRVRFFRIVRTPRAAAWAVATDA